MALLPVFVPVAIMLVLIGLLFEELRVAEAAVQDQVRSKAIIARANALSKLFYDSGVALGGYSITRDQKFLSRFESIRRQIPEDAQELKGLSDSTPVQAQRIAQIDGLTSEGIWVLDDAFAILETAKVGEAQTEARVAYGKIRKNADKIQVLVGQLVACELKIVAPTGEKYSSRTPAWTVSALAILVGLALLAVIAFTLSKEPGTGRPSDASKVLLGGLIPVVVPFVVSCVTVILIQDLQLRVNEEIKQQARGKEIIAHANSFSKVFYDAGVAMGAYSITKSPLFSQRVESYLKQMPVEVVELKRLVKGDLDEDKIVSELDSMSDQGVQILWKTKESIDSDRVDVAQFRARTMYKEIRELANKIQDKLCELTEKERKGEKVLKEIKRSRTLFKLGAVDGVAAAVLSATLLWLILSWNLSKALVKSSSG